MTGKTCQTIIVSSLLISILFTAFLSAPMSMPTMDMGAIDSQMNHQASQKASNNHSIMRCCEMISVTCVPLVLISSQFDEIVLHGENERVINSILALHFTVIQNTTPPPKA